MFFVVNSVAPKLAIKMLQDSLLTKYCANFTRECSKLLKLRTYNHIVSPFISHDAVHYTRLCLPFIVRHFLNCCDQYKNLEPKLFADVSICFPDFLLLSDYKKFNFLLDSL